MRTIGIVLTTVLGTLGTVAVPLAQQAKSDAILWTQVGENIKTVKVLSLAREISAQSELIRCRRELKAERDREQNLAGLLAVTQEERAQLKTRVALQTLAISAMQEVHKLELEKAFAMGYNEGYNGKPRL